MKFLVQQQPAYVYTGGKPFDSSKPTVIFVHGAANDHSVWTLQARYFAHHGWNAMAVDLPGHGKSFGEAKTSIAAYGDWLIDLLDNGAVTKAALVGHSMGSLIALDCAARHGTRVSQIALLGASAPMPVSDVLLDAARHRPAEAFDMLNIWGHAPQLKWGRNPTPGTSSMMAYKRLLEQSRPGILANDLTACQVFVPDDAFFANIRVPALVVAGMRDMMTPAKSAQALAARIADCCVLKLEETGHAMMQEAPGKTLDTLRNFLKS
ncbi:MAG: alpha/beta hydrolase [Betaproteobacteria bacterium]|nr:alpha/beta hydrolase [Betaproteobacteria bacterium]